VAAWDGNDRDLDSVPADVVASFDLPPPPAVGRDDRPADTPMPPPPPTACWTAAALSAAALAAAAAAAAAAAVADTCGVLIPIMWEPAVAIPNALPAPADPSVLAFLAEGCRAVVAWRFRTAAAATAAAAAAALVCTADGTPRMPGHWGATPIDSPLGIPDIGTLDYTKLGPARLTTPTYLDTFLCSAIAFLTAASARARSA